MLKASLFLSFLLALGASAQATGPIEGDGKVERDCEGRPSGSICEFTDSMHDDITDWGSCEQFRGSYACYGVISDCQYGLPEGATCKYFADGSNHLGSCVNQDGTLNCIEFAAA
ncbi:hypothetical protein L218DRAFT_950606 [Marasmius fiardii PR-910]|nr:hypothetical protein L218DRAFT_950606 [Marasmius fiardii PR-910]